MKRLHLLFLILFTCCSEPKLFDSHHGISQKEKSADEVMAEVAKKLFLELGLIPCGTGGQMMYQIQMLSLSFDYYKPISIEEGRKLLLRSMDVFLSSVNSKEKIHPFLANHPFTPKNIEIRIFVHNPDRTDVEIGQIVVASFINGRLTYKTHTVEHPRFVILHRETHEEALQQVALLN